MRRAYLPVCVVVVLLGGCAASAVAGQPLTSPEAIKESMDLDVRLIDTIDCTKADDEHAFKDQGTSSVVDGPAGRYRQTAAHRHAFFAYKFKTAGKDKPVLVVWEYPDDAVRTINFCTHESLLSGNANIDWSLETIAYTGNPLPLSNTMQYHTFIMYPQEAEPAVIVGNFSRYGHPAAASRIWVYAIEKPLPKLQVEAPAPDRQRRFGHFNSFAFLPTSFHFGFRSPNAIEHMLDYCEYVGVNELSWVVVANNSWGFWCTIPSWDRSGGQPDHLDKVLAAMDARGGFGLIASFGPEGDFKMGGKGYLGMEKEELKAALLKGFDEFLDRYSKFKSLRGIALGGMYGIQFYDRLRQTGVLDDVVAHIKARNPDLEVITYLGGRGLHIEYFDGKELPGGKTPTMNDVVTGWETSGKPWSDWLGDQALVAWKAWSHDPAEMKTVPGLTVWEQLQPDDHKIFDLYDQDPRAMVYYDLDNSQRRSDLVDSPYAAIWNTHSEGWFGLHPEVNFWAQKLWVAPDANAPSPLSLATFARTIGLRDRLAIMSGSWNNKYFGHEQHIRRFTKALRSLPPVVMQDVADLPVDTVRVRWVEYEGKRYVSVVSLIPFASQVTVDGRTVDLPPYELVALSDEKSGSPKVEGKLCEEYRKWIAAKIAGFEKLCGEVRALDAAAVPEAYAKVAIEAGKLVAAGRLCAADIALGAGLVNEMQLRKDILDPEVINAPKIASAPPMDGNLDAWPKEASDYAADDGRFIAGHLYFPNSWQGPDDLSARVRLANDGQKLYVGIEVKDSVLAAYSEELRGRSFDRSDSCSVRLSTDGKYLDWKSPGGLGGNLSWSIALPIDKAETSGKGGAGFAYTCRRTETGYVFEGSAPLSDLNVQPGGAMGFLLSLTDVDKTANLKNSGWAAKQVLLFPHKPNFEYWGDVRTCAKLVIGE
ncbi:MAG: hypothetical protein JXL80_10890 [Planctomycetes bacterium]|nr:hypothetical protein [Planctomycetota bacterium]